tara:strand:+ start:575 stop:775 length:201 start_codon:yes stop_codon:yes gene_type:complete
LQSPENGKDSGFLGVNMPEKGPWEFLSDKFLADYLRHDVSDGTEHQLAPDNYLSQKWALSKTTQLS